MKQFLTVLRFEWNNYMKNKSFLLTTILIAAVIVGAILIPPMIPGLLSDSDGSSQGNTQEISEEDLENLGIVVRTEELENVDKLLAFYPAKWTVFDTEEELYQAVEQDEISGGFIVESMDHAVYVVVNLQLTDSTAQVFAAALGQCRKEQYLLEHGLSETEVLEMEMLAGTPEITSEILGKDSVNNYMYTYILIFLVYFLILFYGQMIATSVTTEKSNRAIEILVTSVKPSSLIFGKVLAGALAGILQAVIFLGCAFGAYSCVREAWGGMLDFVLDIPVSVLAAFGVFGILSYLLYAFIYGMLGALVSKTEDISKCATPVTLIYVVSFLIAMFSLSNCDSLLVKIASFIPFTSGNSMFIRIAMGSVSVWEILVSAVILLISCVVTGKLAAMLFRFGTLHYGNPIKFTKALKGARME